MESVTEAKNDGLIEFSDLWNKQLTLQQRKRRLEKAFLISIKAAQRQFNILKKINADDAVQKNIGFIYFYSTVKNFWEHAEFAYSLGKGKNRRFCYFPARLLLETVLRLEFYIKQDKNGQDKIAIEELLRIAKRNYDRDKIEGRDPSYMADFYKNISAGVYPDIEHVKLKFDPFPSTKALSDSSKIEDAKNWYFHFQNLAESTHGKLMSIKVVDCSELADYVRSMMYVSLMCSKALLIIDLHIGHRSKDFVVKAIKEAERIMQAPVIKK